MCIMKHHLDGLAYWTLKNDREHWDFEWNRRNQFLQLAAVAEAQKPPDGNAWEGGGNVSPSMATVVIVLVLGFFITGCIYIYIQHCVTSSSSTATATATATSAAGARAMNSNGTRGLDQSVIDTFPVFQYSAVKELQGALECAVCLSEFQDDETLRLLPKCDHVFHSGCIDAWLVAHSTCPVCRDNLVAVTESPPEEEEFRITIPGDAETTTLSLQNKTFPRSHSTGHSLIQAGDNCERYTLRLPAEVRRQLFARTKLKRATSVIALPRQTSSRRGYRGGGGGEGSGSNRYGRFFGRSFLSRSTAKVGVGGDLTADSQICNTTVATPLDLSFPHQLPV